MAVDWENIAGSLVVRVNDLVDTTSLKLNTLHGLLNEKEDLSNKKNGLSSTDTSHYPNVPAVKYGIDQGILTANSYTDNSIDGIATLLGNKVDKVTGKALSDENFTAILKQKLEEMESSKFRGAYPTIEDLKLEYPEGAGNTWHSGEGGWYADVGGVGQDSLRYIWDVDDFIWVESGIGGLTAEQVLQLLLANPDVNILDDSELAKLIGIEEEAQVNVQSDFGVSDQSLDSYIKNRPTKLTDFINDLTLVDTEYVGSTSILLRTGNEFQRAALTGDVTAARNSNALSIANNAVTTAKIANDAVTTVKILDKNVTSAKLSDGVTGDISKGVTAEGWGDHADAGYIKTYIDTKYTGKAGEITVSAANVIGINGGLKTNIANGQTAFDWGDHSGLYSLLNHKHVIGDVTGLSGALAGKAPTVHSHTIAQVTGLQALLNGKAPTVHTHTIAQITDLGIGVAADLNSTGTTTTNAWSGRVLTTWANGRYAPKTHTHTIADVTNLQTELNKKALKTINLTAGTGLTGGGTIASNRSFAFDTVWGDARYSTVAGAKYTGKTDEIVVSAGREISLATKVTTDIAKGVTAEGWGDHEGLYSLLNHQHVIGDVTGLSGALEGKEASFTKNTAFNKNFGTAANTVMEGDWRPAWEDITGIPGFTTGTVTSVGLEVPTGLSIAGSPITSSGVLKIGFESGYSIPTTDKQNEWDAITSLGLQEVTDINNTTDKRINVESVNVQANEITVANFNKYKPILLSNGNVLIREITSTWNGTSWVSGNGIAVGNLAGANNSGDNQLALGYQAGRDNSGDNQAALGLYAGQDNSGDNQAALGLYAGQDNSGGNQAAVGNAAGQYNSGGNQAAIGYQAGRYNSGGNQVAIGNQAGRYNSGDNQAAIGYQAGQYNSGGNQAAIGYQAGRYNSGDNQAAIGYQAGQYNSGDNNNIIGQNYTGFQVDNTFTVVAGDINNNEITIAGHGITQEGLLRVPTTINSTRYLAFEVKDANTLKVTNGDLTANGGLVEVAKRHDQINILGYNLNPTRSNQTTLGGHSIFAPESTIAEINDVGNKALTTVEWVNDQGFATVAGATYTGSASIHKAAGNEFQREALTGDVTATRNSNELTIANKAVSYAKFQNMPTKTLLGNAKTASGVSQPITLGSNLTLSVAGVLNSAISTYAKGTSAELVTGTSVIGRLWDAKVLTGHFAPIKGYPDWSAQLLSNLNF